MIDCIFSALRRRLVLPRSLNTGSVWLGRARFLHVLLSQVDVHLFCRIICQTGIELFQRLRGWQDHLVAGLSVERGRYVVLVHKLQCFQVPQNLVQVAAHAQGVERGETNLSVGVDDKDGPHGGGRALTGLDHPAQAFHLQVVVGNDGKPEIHASFFANVVTQGMWALMLSVLSPSNSVLRAVESSCRAAKPLISLVHTGVKSAG